MDYELIDTGQGRRLERFGKYVLDRPDPQIVWDRLAPQKTWDLADASFVRTFKDKGLWKLKSKIPESWTISHNNIRLKLKLSPFKHTGVFPEQSWEWDLISEAIKKESHPVNILNLFGYTGAASISAVLAGASVTHVDASKPALSWFRENVEENGLADKPIRYIPEDSLKFVEREIKRGHKYDGIIMDPPVYGHGPKGETWAFNKNFPELLDKTMSLLSENPIFVIINAYAISTSSITLANILTGKTKSLGGKVTHGELTLQEVDKGRTLSTGIWSMWTK